MSKTIKQIADELGVSKQAVSKCIDNLGLRSTLTKNGNYFVVGDSQEKAIKQAFAAHQTANQKCQPKRQPNANRVGGCCRCFTDHNRHSERATCR